VNSGTDSNHAFSIRHVELDQPGQRPGPDGCKLHGRGILFFTSSQFRGVWGAAGSLPVDTELSTADIVSRPKQT
jgi:hypothetical protein